MVKILPRQGTKARDIYNMIAEFPGTEVSALEIADECGLSLRIASAHACQLVKRELVQIKDNGRGRSNRYYVEANDESS